MVERFHLGPRLVGPGQDCLIIAEAGVNHNGRVELALELVDAAADAEADAVKFQTFQASQLTTAAAPKAEYQLRNTGTGGSQLEMLRQLELSPDDHRQIVQRCRERGILFLSTPFDCGSADLLDALDVPAFKISSGDLTDLPLLEHIAGKHRPMIVSTGMADMGEVEDAVQVLECHQVPFALLHCVSNYPAHPAEVNLRAMLTMQAAFGVPVGYSDHTTGTCISVAAVALGASVIEKHFTLDRNLPGPDHQASLEPAELQQLVREIRDVERALGTGRKEPAPSERATAAVARKSLVAARDIPAGATLTDELLSLKRPGTGLPPAMRPHLLNRTARCVIPAGTQIRLENVA